MFRSISSFALGVLILVVFLNSVHAATTGCGKTPTLKSGNQTTTINGKQRKWILRIPDNYNSTRPYRFIFGLHWLTGSMTSVDTGSTPYYGLKALAQNSAIFVAPDGLNNGWANSGGEDITFLDTIRQQIDNDLCVNEKLRFSLGFSYGGAMSFSLACSKAKDFRAIAVLSGATLSGCSGGNDPIAYYGQHGVKDSVLPIDLGRQIRDRFVKNNGCQAKTAPEPAKNSKQRITTVYDGCKYPTQYTAFDGDHLPLPDDAGNDAGANSFTPAEVWKFFQQFE
ncbi:carbohydrate esterase family 1 protein [Lentithecium fluviatile CBS 122367]|uniref:Feruloyl esterase C n=1 Tax=Lentithecium fluviatile CBS 122367 TaxID=1168545 RepID=A0A6G1J9B2_9PLEO|nr:carbohydrate esterase family 1 protein [Lentithecium fluviatile CBS 122367]